MTDVMSDEEKHADCIKRTGNPATFVAPSLYDKIEREGGDMRYFVKQKLIPTDQGAFHNPFIRGDVYANGSVMTDEQMKNQYSKLAPSKAERWNTCPGQKKDH